MENCKLCSKGFTKRFNNHKYCSDICSSIAMRKQTSESYKKHKLETDKLYRLNPQNKPLPLSNISEHKRVHLLDAFNPIDSRNIRYSLNRYKITLPMKNREVGRPAVTISLDDIRIVYERIDNTLISKYTYNAIQRREVWLQRFKQLEKYLKDKQND